MSAYIQLAAILKKKKKSNKKRKIKRWIAPGIFSAAITKAVSVYGVPIAE